MTVREIHGHLDEIYGVDVSPELISAVTEDILDAVAEWRNRRLENLYPPVFFDALRLKFRNQVMVRDKAVYVVLGVRIDGQKVSRSGFAGGWLVCVLRGQRLHLQGFVEGGFGFRRRDEADGLEQPSVIEPADPLRAAAKQARQRSCGLQEKAEGEGGSSAPSRERHGQSLRTTSVVSGRSCIWPGRQISVKQHDDRKRILAPSANALETPAKRPEGTLAKALARAWR